MLKLGYTVDIGPSWIPVDLTTAGATGLRACLKNAQSVIFVVSLAAAGSGTEDVVLTFKEHTASSGGTSTNLGNLAGGNANGVAVWWIKSATTLAGTEPWVKQTGNISSNGAVVTIPGATYAAKQVIAAFQFNTKDLDDGYDYISCSVADPGSVSRLGTCQTLLTDLVTRRDPANMPPTLL